MLCIERPDVPKVEEFRAWVTEQWYPRQSLPIIPCLPSQRSGAQEMYEDEGRGLRSGRRQLQDEPTPGIPYTTHVSDLLDKCADLIPPLTRSLGGAET